MNPGSLREASVLSLVPKSSAGGFGISAVGAMNHNEVLALAGFVITLLGFCVNLFLQVRKDRRDAALNAAQLAAVRKG